MAGEHWQTDRASYPPSAQDWGGRGAPDSGAGVEDGEVRGQGGDLLLDGGGQAGRLRLWGGAGRAEGEHWDGGEVVERNPHL